MADWIFKRSPETRLTAIYSDRQLAGFVTLGTVSGCEMVRPANGDGEWIPVYTLPWYRDAVQAAANVTSEDIARARHSKRGRKLFGLIGGIYGSIIVFASMMGASAQTKNPVFGVIGGLAMAGGIGAVIARSVRQSRRANAAVAMAGDAPPLTAAQTASGERDELHEALHALEQDLSAIPDALRVRVDIGAIKRAAAALREQRQVLAGLLVNDQEIELRKELESAREQGATTTDPSLLDAFSDQVRTLEARIDSLASARRATAENEARQRALLHEIASLRIELGRSRVDVSLEDQTIDRLTQLKAQLEEEARIASELDESIRGPKHAAKRAIGP